MSLPKTRDDSKLSLSKMGSFQIDKSPVIFETNAPIISVQPVVIDQIILNTSHLSINRKTVILTVMLLFIGVGLFAGGFVTFILSNDPKKSIVFWVVGSLVLIPGLYYLWNFISVWKTKNRKNKVEIVKEINQQY